MTVTKRRASVTGYVENMFGRRYYYPDLASKQQKLRSRAERQCINAIIQGSAAELFRLAIARVCRTLLVEGWAADVLLPVHDELLIECDEAVVEPVMVRAKAAMESAAEPFGIEWTVPIIASPAFGDNWREAH